MYIAETFVHQIPTLPYMQLYKLHNNLWVYLLKQDPNWIGVTQLYKVYKSVVPPDYEGGWWPVACLYTYALSEGSISCTLGLWF